MSEHKSSFGDFLTGILVGGFVGYVVALLNAPRPGDETRQMLTERSRELRDMALDKTEKLVATGRDRAETVVETTRNRAQERVSDLKERSDTMVTDAREQASDTLHRVADKIDPDTPSRPVTDTDVQI